MKHQKLNLFFSNSKIIEKVNDALTDMKGETSFKVSEFGKPVTIPDQVILSMYLMTFLENVHFVPGRKPAIGIATGDFEEIEGKKYLYGNIGVMRTNSYTFHLTRQFEEAINNWLDVENEVKEKIKNLQQFLVNNPELSEKLNLFSDFVGFNAIETPSPQFVKTLKKIQNSFKESLDKEVTEDLFYLINTCKEFCHIGKSLVKIREITHSKGFAFIERNNRFMQLNTPAASGGASWFQTNSTEIINAAPFQSNLTFFLLHSGKYSGIEHTIGSGTTPEKSIKFITPPGIVEKLQSIVASSEHLNDLWKNCEPSLDFTDEVNRKRFSTWANAVHKTLYTFEVANIIKNSIHNDVIGIQLDLTEPNQQTVYLKPVMTKSFWDSFDKTTGSVPEVEHLDFENFLMNFSDQYAIPSIPSA